MLRIIRKYSSSAFAKIFLIIIAIPFIFWGMGPVFRGGKKNTIVEIGKEKISIQDFVNYIKYNATSDQKINENFIKKLLSDFIGAKIISEEPKTLE